MAEATTASGVARVGVIGLGQCGGNIATELKNRGYPAFAVNTSVGELQPLELDDEQKLLVSLTPEQWSETIGAATRSQLQGCDTVVVIGGLGGSTGAELPTVASILVSHDVMPLAMAVLPMRTDGFAVKRRALESINRLVDAPFGSVMVVDNQKLWSRFSSESIDTFLKCCNGAIADAFERAHRVAMRPGLVPIRSFEQRAFMAAFGGGGVAIFGEAELESLSHESLLQAFVDIVNSNDLLASEHTIEDVIAAGSVVIANDEQLAKTSVASFDGYFEEVSLLTGGLNHEIGIYRGDVAKPQLFVIASGMGLPTAAAQLLEQLQLEAQRLNNKGTSARSKLRRLDLSTLPEASTMTPTPSSALRTSGEVRTGPPPLSRRGLEVEPVATTRSVNLAAEQQATKANTHLDAFGAESEEIPLAKGSEPAIDLDIDDEITDLELILDDAMSDSNRDEAEPSTSRKPNNDENNAQASDSDNSTNSEASENQATAAQDAAAAESDSSEQPSVDQSSIARTQVADKDEDASSADADLEHSAQ